MIEEEAEVIFGDVFQSALENAIQSATTLADEMGMSENLAKELIKDASRAVESIMNMPMGFANLDAPDEFIIPKKIKKIITDNPELISEALASFTYLPWLYLAKKNIDYLNTSEKDSGFFLINAFKGHHSLDEKDYLGFTDEYKKIKRQFWDYKIDEKKIAFIHLLKIFYINQTYKTDYVTGYMDEIPKEVRDLNLTLFKPVDFKLDPVGGKFYTEKGNPPRDRGIFLLPDYQLTNFKHAWEDKNYKIQTRIKREVFSIFPEKVIIGHFGNLDREKQIPADLDKQKELYSDNFPWEYTGGESTKWQFKQEIDIYNDQFRELFEDFIEPIPERAREFQEMKNKLKDPEKPPEKPLKTPLKTPKKPAGVPLGQFEGSVGRIEGDFNRPEFAHIFDAYNIQAEQKSEDEKRAETDIIKKTFSPKYAIIYYENSDDYGYFDKGEVNVEEEEGVNYILDRFGNWYTEHDSNVRLFYNKEDYEGFKKMMREKKEKQEREENPGKKVRKFLESDSDSEYYIPDNTPSIEKKVKLEEHIDRVIGEENPVINRNSLPLWAFGAAVIIGVGFNN